jgi:cytochrome P450
MTDGDEHARLRMVTGRPLIPRALAKLKPEASKLAATLVEGLVARGTFDGVTDLAQVMPTRWVPDLLGLPKEGRENLLDWAGAGFDTMGPANERWAAAQPRLAQVGQFAEAAIANGFPPGSMAAGVLEAAARGEIRPEQCPQSLLDYILPSIDTTVSAIGSAIWLLATHPDQWQLLHREPQRASQAFDEALRLESPVSGFTRVATKDTEVGGVSLPGGARVLVLFAAANRDEREWVESERFDITRANAAAHLAFGYGVHVCVGMGSRPVRCSSPPI